MPEGKRPRKPETLLRYLRWRVSNLAGLAGVPGTEKFALTIEHEAYGIIAELRASLRSRP